MKNLRQVIFNLILSLKHEMTSGSAISLSLFLLFLPSYNSCIFGNFATFYSCLVTRTFKNVDSIIGARQFECQRCVMGFEDAQVVVQNGQLAPWIAEEPTRCMSFRRRKSIKIVIEAQPRHGSFSWIEFANESICVWRAKKTRPARLKTITVGNVTRLCNHDSKVSQSKLSKSPQKS